MEEKFPYEASMVVVTEDMCDLNGHMNVAYYLQAFDIYSRPMFEDFGFTKEHFKKMKPTSYIINAARGNIIDEHVIFVRYVFRSY